MSGVQAQIRAEVLGALNQHGVMGRQELLDSCPTAESASQISLALGQLKKTEEIERTDAGWQLAKAPAKPASDLTPPCFCDGASSGLADRIERATQQRADDPIIRAIRDMQSQHRIHDAARKILALRELANWPAMDGSVAAYLREIADDIELVAASA